MGSEPQAGFRGAAGATGAPTTAAYWVGALDATLTAEVVPSGGTGITVTAATGVIAIDTAVVPQLASANTFTGANNIRIANSGLTINNPAATFTYNVVGGAIVANRQINLPVLLGTDTIAFLGMAQTFTGVNNMSGNNVINFANTGLTVKNPANTFSYTIVGGAITGNRNITIPVTAGADTFGLLSVAQTWSGVNTFSTALSIASGGTNNGALGVSAVGVITADGSKLVQVTGTASQQLRVNAGATAIEFFTAAGGTGNFAVTAKAGSYTASDGGMFYYRNSATGTITLPASPADGSVRKFKQTAGTGTFALNGAEVINLANGTTAATGVLTQVLADGVMELIAVTGGWDET